MAQKAAIFLTSDVAAFTCPETLVDTLRVDFPQVHFVHCSDEAAFLAELPDAAIAITWPFKAPWYILAPQLQRIFTPAAGSDWIAASPEHGAAVVHGTFHGRMMSESLVGMILHASRRFGIAEQNQFNHAWNRTAFSSTTLLENQTILFAGFGHIGRWCARRLKPFGCRMYGLQRQQKGGIDPETGTILITESELDAVLPLVQHLVSILPGGPETDSFFSQERLARLSPGSYFHNIGRGNCIAERDLIRALETGTLAGAALDVFENEPLCRTSALWDHTDVLITPHASCIYREYMELYMQELAVQLRQFIDNKDVHP